MNEGVSTMTYSAATVITLVTVCKLTEKELDKYVKQAINNYNRCYNTNIVHRNIETTDTNTTIQHIDITA